MPKVNELEITNPGLVYDTIEKALQRVAGEVMRDAKRLAPRSPRQPPPRDPSQPVTGNLKNQIAVRRVSADEYRVVSPVHYGIYQEFGTVHIPARPFMGPALEAARRKWGA